MESSRERRPGLHGDPRPRSGTLPPLLPGSPGHAGTRSPRDPCDERNRSDVRSQLERSQRPKEVGGNPATGSSVAPAGRCFPSRRKGVSGLQSCPAVVDGRRFRALSLDLWFTALYHSAETDRGWQERRAEFLQGRLRPSDGRAFTFAEIVGAVESAESRLRADGRHLITLDPRDQLRAYADQLDCEFADPTDEVAERYSAVGIAEYPPLVNPEAVRLVGALAEQKVPVIVVTNSARRGSTWLPFLRERLHPGVHAVVSSCDLGSAKPEPGIFLEAARRLGLPPEQILHVGDRWELDVDGAERAGFGAGLYTGLWSRYPPGLYPPDAAPHRDGVLRIPRLEELLADGWF
jgi:FMN phosphatase YigB (HAD superfamily)